jgi:hypothetical protein
MIVLLLLGAIFFYAYIYHNKLLGTLLLVTFVGSCSLMAFTGSDLGVLTNAQRDGMYTLSLVACIASVFLLMCMGVIDFVTDITLVARDYLYGEKRVSPTFSLPEEKMGQSLDKYIEEPKAQKEFADQLAKLAFMKAGQSLDITFDQQEYLNLVDSVSEKVVSMANQDLLQKNLLLQQKVKELEAQNLEK